MYKNIPISFASLELPTAPHNSPCSGALCSVLIPSLLLASLPGLIAAIAPLPHGRRQRQEAGGGKGPADGWRVRLGSIFSQKGNNKNHNKYALNFFPI